MIKKLFLAAAIFYFLLIPIAHHPDNKLVLFWGSLDEGRVWNIYEYGEKYLTDTGKPQFNYPPVNFLLVKLQYLIARPIGGPEYADWLESPNELDAQQPQIFRYALATKLVLMLVTLAIGLLIYALVKQHGLTEKQAALAAGFWWFNPITVYSGVLMGQNDVLAVFLFLLGWLLLKPRWILSTILFGLSISVKNYPLIWMGLLVLTQPLLGWVKKFITIGGAILVYLLTILPFLNNTVFQNAVLNSPINDRFFIATINLGLGDRVIIIPVLLITILVFAISFARQKLNISSRAFIIMAANLVLLGFVHFHPQWFTWLIPFWAIWMANQVNQKKTIESLINSSLVFCGWLIVILLFKDISLYYGMMLPLNPNLVNLPILSNFLSARNIDVERINNLGHSVIAGAALAAVIGVSKLSNEPQQKNKDDSSILLKGQLYLDNLLQVINKFIQKMSRVNFLVVSLLAPLLIWFGLFFMSHLIPSQQKAANYSQLKFSEPSYPLTATFEGKENYLNRINIWMRNPGFASQEKVKLILHNEVGQEISSQSYHGSNVGDPGLLRMDVPAQIDSQDKKFEVRLELISQPESVLKVAALDQDLALDHYYRPPFNLLKSLNNSWVRFNLMLGQIWYWYLLISFVYYILLTEIKNFDSYDETK